MTDQLVVPDLRLSLAGEGGPGPRWRPGERLHDLIADRIDGRPAEADAPAIETRDGRCTFADLEHWSDALANRLAPVVRAGDRVALLFDRSPHAVVAMLALSKLAAAWVPLDAAFPADRMAYICADAAVRIALTREPLLQQLAGVPIAHVAVPDFTPAMRDEPRFTPRPTAEDLAWIVYTSGTTGAPKGVPIGHAAACNFVRVAASCYGFRPTDRVYQGLTIAFDFSVEEIWVPLAVGACLVPPPDGVALIGDELTAFLRARRVTALCCVPTLLATLAPGCRRCGC